MLAQRCGRRHAVMVRLLESTVAVVGHGLLLDEVEHGLVLRRRKVEVPDQLQDGAHELRHLVVVALEREPQPGARRVRGGVGDVEHQTCLLCVVCLLVRDLLDDFEHHAQAHRPARARLRHKVVELHVACGFWDPEGRVQHVPALDRVRVDHFLRRCGRALGSLEGRALGSIGVRERQVKPRLAGGCLVGPLGHELGPERLPAVLGAVPLLFLPHRVRLQSWLLALRGDDVDAEVGGAEALVDDRVDL
mmetsp:Transcript_39276/g.92616  ORF Transcript_39276/g.92616 Transcript_39276/m.92616 type:complete len:248 (+) Transcript_39276:1079-1822(+)